MSTTQRPEPEHPVDAHPNFGSIEEPCVSAEHGRDLAVGFWLYLGLCQNRRASQLPLS
jgi:hypothetical protein